MGNAENSQHTRLLHGGAQPRIHRYGSSDFFQHHERLRLRRRARVDVHDGAKLYLDFDWNARRYCHGILSSCQEITDGC